MNKIPTVLIAGLTVMALFGPAAAEGLADLTALTAGDHVALQLSLYAPVAWQNTIRSYDAPFVAYFNRKDGLVVINIFGTRDDMEFVRQLMDTYRNLVETDFISYLSKSRELAVKPSDFRITYRNRNEEGIKELLIWEQGKFKFPLEK